jgi:hypothetical protein
MPPKQLGMFSKPITVSATNPAKSSENRKIRGGIQSTFPMVRAHIVCGVTLCFNVVLAM